jgi:hypothetical protein
MRKHLTYANVVSTICLFVVLGGTSVAAVTLTRGSVKGKHIARNAVTSAKVKNRSLRARDFARASLPAGPAGPAGERGAQGEQGPPGAPGSAAAYAHVNPDGSIDPNRSKGVVGSARGTQNSFCITFDVPPRNVVATPHGVGTTGLMAVVRTTLDSSPPLSPCTVDGVDYDVLVRVFDHANVLGDHPFEIAVN